MFDQSSQLEIPANTRLNNFALGILFVVLGSSSYGMLSTFVKLSYKQNFTTAEVTIAQFFWGALVLTIMGFFVDKTAPKVTATDIRKLMVAGIPVGLTSVFYYLAVKYIDASVAVVLLMQSVWMGVVVEAFQTKSFPKLDKIFAVVMILFGTLLATNVLGSSHGALDIRGVILGLVSAMSFSWTMFSTSSVASHLPPVKRSQFMVYSGGIVVTVFGLLTQVGPHYFELYWVGEEFIRNQPFNPQIFLTYGLIVAIFGTIIPPIMLNKGFPIVGVGLGSILSSVELPFAVTIAFIFLNEQVIATQWLGVAVIISAIVLLNYKLIAPGNKSGRA
ncbi:EamA family transporter [Bdellovibrio sp. HCB209]|uniref:EamA family transporter n=1 Tax=Bdellovibrio sp. HCB209 TaxID=3394354 RepID=UPI0039B55402